MSTSTVDEEEKTNIVMKSFHYFVALIFFLVILVNTLYLTKAALNMSVSSGDTNAQKAKNLMIGGCAISYFGDLLILCIIAFAYYYNFYHPTEASDYSDKLMEKTGGENIYVAFRVIIFSILMIVSLLVGALCIEAANYIDKSDDPSQYNTEYNLCKDMGQMFMLHFMIFTILQGAGYLYKLCYDTGNIRVQPESIMK